MRQLRFYIPFTLELNQQYDLPDNTARHMVRVLRLSQGDEVTLFNGDNHEYSAQLTDVSKKAVSVLITSKSFVDRESPLKTHLLQSLSKGDKMETTIQKAVELGVSAVTPISSERSNVTLSGKRLEKKMSHWQGVVQSACEQSGRNVVPELSGLSTLTVLLDALKGVNALKLILSPHCSADLKSVRRPTGEVYILIGPEGGFSDQEMAHAQACGFVAVKAGPRVLRTETAGPAILSALQLLWGDLV